MSETRQAIVVANYGHEVLIQDQRGTQHRAKPRGQLPALVTGDHIEWRSTPDDTIVVETLLPRHGLLTRSTKSNPNKLIASNVDIAMIVCAIKPAYRTGLIDRYLVACEFAGITPIIVFNKIDLLSKEDSDRVVNELAVYERIGYTIYRVCTKVVTGISQLREAVIGSTAILVGQSGVGKSSIIRTLAPDTEPVVASVSTATNKGRHTTTTTHLYTLDESTHIIDSPGIREFGLKPVDVQQLSQGFREFQPFLGQCKFRDCTHHSEPGCAIAEAVKTGEIHRKRWQSYRAIADSFAA